MLIIYAVTIFLSATLLFLVQPMFARMALPLLGGAPAVWNTAVVFYQAALLAGYGYAHATTARLPLRRQVVIHLVVLLLPLLLLPIGVPRGWTPPSHGNPIPWLLLLMVVTVGLPFFAVSTSTPLFQKWFSLTGHGASADPYFLYAASNLGSMLALLSYPALVEPYLGLAAQSRLWTAGYALLVVLALGCAASLWRSPASVTRSVGVISDPPIEVPEAPGLTAGRRLRWVLLSFVPSSLMLSVTTYLSTDIAAIPLLWVIPLAIYLLTFILVFAQKPLLPHRLMVEALPIVMLPLVLVLLSRATGPLALVLLPHPLALFVVGMVCHGELARDRPSTRHLTEFYLWLSLGGVLGGVFTALIAALIFTTVLEYQITLVLACLLARRPTAVPVRPLQRLLDVALPLALGVLAAALVILVQRGDSPATHMGLVFGFLVLLCYGFSRRPIRFGLGIGAILLAGTLYSGEEGRLLYAERSFFGINRVTLDRSAEYHLLMHGTTLHGIQSLDPARRLEPLAYFHATGPLGQVFAALDGAQAPKSVGVVGLGTGSVACHGRPGQRWTYYEIDPAVERIARDPRYFTFLRDCPPDIRVVLGDARLSLAAAGRGAYDLLVLDAYSSDAPPLHLMTREALRLYLDRLAPRGILVFNISNRHMEFEPVLANLARDAGLAALVQDDAVVSEDEYVRGKRPSEWVVMARELADLGTLATDPRWRPARGLPAVAVWTDSYTALLKVLRWPGRLGPNAQPSSAWSAPAVN
ncbi:MAG: fused MFS/spermidine synthase [Candidatus Rokubacteria bacterium]|nr:fused MFS/spermidine synthase [Candidatus Rokubacteria bacterium]